MNTRQNIDSLFEVTFTGNYDNVDYKGFRVLMRPSKFLELAHSIYRPIPSKLDRVRDAVRNKMALNAYPFLNLNWNPKIPAWEVTGHEGRHRMMVIGEEEGDDPIEVHIFPHGDGTYFSGHSMRSQTTDEMFKELMLGMFSEEGEYVRHPIESMLPHAE
jgi:hypothetical protein